MVVLLSPFNGSHQCFIQFDVEHIELHLCTKGAIQIKFINELI